MKKTIAYFSAVFFTLSTLSVSAQLYWDINGATPGAGGANPSGTWDTTTANWTTDASGSSATVDWTDGNTAYFAAGSDASGSYTVTVSGTQSPGAINFGNLNTSTYGDVTLTGGTLEFAGGGGIEVDGGQGTINSVIDGGTGPLNLLLFGTLTLGGNNTFSNTVSVGGVGGATLRMGASGDILPLASVLVSGATLDLNNNSVGIGSVQGPGNISLGTGTLTNLGVGANTTFSGVVSGSGSGIAVVKAGPNNLTFNNENNTFTGKVLITGGIFMIPTNNALGTDPISPVADQITISNGGALQFTSTKVTIPVNRGIYVGLPYGILAVSSGQSPTVLANITGPGSMQKGNSGNVNLDGTNTFSGGFTITGGGVRFNTDIAAGTGTITVAPASLVTLRNIAPNTTSSTVTNAIKVNAGKADIEINAASGNTFTLSGPISGTAISSTNYLTRGRVTGSAGNVVLSGNNSGWGGGLVYIGGTLTLGHKNALGTGTTLITPGSVNPVILQASTPLTGADAVATPMIFAVTNLNFSIGGVNALELSGPITLRSNTPSITVSNTAVTTFSGPISGDTGIGLTKVGDGVLTLSGANTYTGPTTIHAGTLLVDSPGSLGSSSAVTVNAGGTLGGSGTINGSVTVASGGTISAGDSPGTLTLANGLDLSAGGTNAWELAANSASNPGTDFDQIVLTGGSLALGGSSALQVNFLGSVNFADSFWGANHSWKIINGSNPGSSTFASINGTNGITAGTFAVSADTTGVYLDYTAAAPALPQPHITSTVLSGGNLILQGTNGAIGGSYSVLTSTNVALPLSSWTTNITGFFTGTGAFSNGIPVSGSPRRFFLIKQP